IADLIARRHMREAARAGDGERDARFPARNADRVRNDAKASRAAPWRLHAHVAADARIRGGHDGSKFCRMALLRRHAAASRKQDNTNNDERAHDLYLERAFVERK